jgi:hypothetical protein
MLAEHLWLGRWQRKSAIIWGTMFSSEEWFQKKRFLDINRRKEIDHWESWEMFFMYSLWSRINFQFGHHDKSCNNSYACLIWPMLD